MKDRWLGYIIKRSFDLARRRNNLSTTERAEWLALETQLDHVFDGCPVSQSVRRLLS